MTNIAYHFTGDELIDGQPIPPIGQTLVYPGKIELRVQGYHWSRTPWQALQYAPGPLLHKVRIGGEVIEHPDDNGVSSERTIIASIDATYLCRRFAADQALSVAHLWDMPQVVLDYLTTLDESLRAAAREAAAEASRFTTARGAAWTGARDAAWAAAREATAWAAARDAASAASRVAAVEASRAAVARDAAWRAAWADASAAACEDFNRRVDAAFDGAAK